MDETSSEKKDLTFMKKIGIGKAKAETYTSHSGCKAWFRGTDGFCEADCGKSLLPGDSVSDESPWDSHGGCIYGGMF